MTSTTWLQNERFRRVWVWVILPVLVYVLAAGIMTWPLARHIDDHAAGVGYGDTYMMLRQAWEARAQILDGENPFHQARIAYPDGATSRVMWSTPLRWFPVLLLMFVFPPVMAFNLWLIVTLTLNGLTAYWLGMALARRHVPAALLGGLVFAAFPTMQGHLSVGHMDVLAMYGLPLFALCWWRVLFTSPLNPLSTRGEGTSQREWLPLSPFTGKGGWDDRGKRTWRTVLWGGVWFAVASLGLTSQIIYNLMPLVMFSGLYALIAQRGRVMPRGTVWHRWPLTRAAAMVALGGVILLPFFGPLLTAAGGAELEHLRETGRVTFSADPLAFVSPSPFGPLDDLGLVPGYASDVLATNSAEGAAYLGLAAGVLALVGVLACKSARPWLAVALGAMLLSLGPLLKWHDEPVSIEIEDLESYVTLPWAAVQDWPVLQNTRTAGRFNGATALAWGALVSTGAGVALRRIRRREIQIGVTVLLAAVILVEYQLFWPYFTGSADQPDYFDQLAEMDDVDAVYNAPALHATAQMQAMAQQMVHGKPMIAGQLYRISPQDPARLALVDAAVLGDKNAPLPALPPAVLPVLVSETGADRVIVHTRFVPQPDAVIERVREAFGAPEFRDDWHAAFVVPDDVTVWPEFFAIAASGAGWSERVALAENTRYTFLDESGAWYFYTAAPYGELTFDTAPYHTPRRIAVWLDDQPLTVLWAGGETVRLPLWVEPGFHTLRFESLDGCDPYPFDLRCLALPAERDCMRAESPVCISAGFSAPVWLPSEELTPLEVTLDQDVRLRGYALDVQDDPRALRVRLFWDADHALDRSYALFVHVADSNSAAPYAQYADFPAIQTDQWDEGAVWVSDVVIPLDEGIAAGDYAINAGWFVPDSGARLGVQTARPWSDAGIVYLETVQIE